MEVLDADLEQIKNRFTVYGMVQAWVGHFVTPITLP
jgi:hypothetical protein